MTFAKGVCDCMPCGAFHRRIGNCPSCGMCFPFYLCATFTADDNAASGSYGGCCKKAKGILTYSQGCSSENHAQWDGGLYCGLAEVLGVSVKAIEFNSSCCMQILIGGVELTKICGSFNFTLETSIEETEFLPAGTLTISQDGGFMNPKFIASCPTCLWCSCLPRTICAVYAISGQCRTQAEIIKLNWDGAKWSGSNTFLPIVVGGSDEDREISIEFCRLPIYDEPDFSGCNALLKVNDFFNAVLPVEENPFALANPSDPNPEKPVEGREVKVGSTCYFTLGQTETRREAAPPGGDIVETIRILPVGFGLPGGSSQGHGRGCGCPDPTSDECVGACPVLDPVVLQCGPVTLTAEVIAPGCSYDGVSWAMVESQQGPGYPSGFPASAGSPCQLYGVRDLFINLGATYALTAVLFYNGKTSCPDGIADPFGYRLLIEVTGTCMTTLGTTYKTYGTPIEMSCDPFLLEYEFPAFAREPEGDYTCDLCLGEDTGKKIRVRIQL